MKELYLSITMETSPGCGANAGVTTSAPASSSRAWKTPGTSRNDATASSHDHHPAAGHAEGEDHPEAVRERSAITLLTFAVMNRPARSDATRPPHPRFAS